jgi:uncharacterized membrane-anchored protein YitT (DUF2179 family)
MMASKQNKIKREIITIFCLTLASAVIAFNLKSFVDTGGLFPGGFSGVTILLQGIGSNFFDINIPYSVIYLPLNLIPAFIGVKYISKRFTFYSFYVVFLSGVLTDIFPSVTITYDTLLISIFGGIINGACMSVCLTNGASGGGTDFISIFFSEKKGVDAWSYILMGNIVVLVTAGLLFGFDRALYSIIYQYSSTQVIQLLFKRYQKNTLLIITSVPDAIYGKLRELTHHDATMIRGIGMYEGSERHILYSVVGREEINKLVSEINKIDPKAFINIIRTDQVSGRFYKMPY